MPQAKPGIATTILAPVPGGEGFVEISPNKTLFLQQLTHEEPSAPEIQTGLETLDMVFNHYKPNCDVELEKEDGSTQKENFAFNSLADFDVKSLTNQSGYLKNLSIENDGYLKIVKQLKSNKPLKTVIENPETKNAFLDSLKALIAEIENSSNE